MPKLTVKEVDRAKHGRHGDGEGLYLLVAPTGGKSWMLRVVIDGKRRDIGLGSATVLSLGEARDRSRELRKVTKMGGDLFAFRDKDRATIPTFDRAIKACREARKGKWTERHAQAFENSLEIYAVPRLGKMRVDSIDESDVLAVLSPIWSAKPAAARKVRQFIGSVLNFAKVKHWRKTGAPSEGLGELLPYQPNAGNFASMPYSAVPAFVEDLRIKPVTMGRLALLFTILTAARGGEVRTARWSHIDFEAKTWTRPASLMKKDRQHVVTLSSSAVAVLRQAEKLRTTLADTLIFPGAGGKPLADMTLLKISKADGRGYSTHGFRSSFSTWAAEKMPTIPEAVVEEALAHLVRDQVVRAYRRAAFLDMRRTLLDAWGDFVDGKSSVLRLVG